MAVRYSGDAEVRVFWDPDERVYRGYVSNGRFRFHGTAPRRLRDVFDIRSSDAYDHAARTLLEKARDYARAKRLHLRLEHDDHGDVAIRRVFRSPCPG